MAHATTTQGIRGCAALSLAALLLAGCSAGEERPAEPVHTTGTAEAAPPEGSGEDTTEEPDPVETEEPGDDQAEDDDQDPAEDPAEEDPQDETVSGDLEWSLDEPLDSVGLRDALLEDGEYADSEVQEFPEGFLLQEPISTHGDISGDGLPFSKSLTLPGWVLEDECSAAMDAIDSIEVTATHALEATVSDGEHDVQIMIVATPDEHELFRPYYQELSDACDGYVDPDGDLIEVPTTSSAEGVHISLEVYGEPQPTFHMAGYSFGHNHVLLLNESGIDDEVFDEILGAQVQKLHEQVQ